MESRQDKKGTNHSYSTSIDIAVGMNTLTVAFERNSLSSHYVQELQKHSFYLTVPALKSDWMSKIGLVSQTRLRRSQV